MALRRLLSKYRTFIRIAISSSLLMLLIIIVYDPVSLLDSLPMVDAEYDLPVDPGRHNTRVDDVMKQQSAETPSPKQRSPRSRDFRPFVLPFLPKDYACDDIMERSGRRFSYSDSYWDHADAYKSALAMNNILSHGATNEVSWILQDLARIPNVDTICETAFDAGSTTFQWLVADDTTVVHSFDRMSSNYSQEMADFMAIEFPDSFYIHEGDPGKTIPDFVHRNSGNVTCDVVFVATSEPADVIESNIVNLRKMVNRDRHFLVLDTHPDAHQREHAGRIWRSLIDRGIITEYFKCHFDNKAKIGLLENGLTIGAYN